MQVACVTRWSRQVACVTRWSVQVACVTRWSCASCMRDNVVLCNKTWGCKLPRLCHKLSMHTWDISVSLYRTSQRSGKSEHPAICYLSHA